jgi:Tripartite tricarboxylate transporter family receptor
LLGGPPVLQGIVGLLEIGAHQSRAQRSPVPEQPRSANERSTGQNASHYHRVRRARRHAPEGTGPNVIARLNDAAVKAMAMPALQKRFAELGQDRPAPNQLSPAALRALQKGEIDKWWPIVKTAHIRAN